MSRNFFRSTYSGKNSQARVRKNLSNLKILRTRRANGMHYLIPRFTALPDPDSLSFF